jgi:hyperosmotically inducible periplasmic protein
MHSHPRIASAACGTIAAVILLAAAGCNRQGDDRTAGQRVDDGIARTEQKSAEIGEQAREAGQAASAAVGRATDEVAAKTRDMGITAEMKARLAKDRQLSALRIDVDTRDGRVILRGAAPTPAARERATELARGIEGVMGVENELQVQAPTGKPS